MKYNSILSTIVPVERLFSVGGQILTPKRNLLDDECFEDLLCLKQTLKSKFMLHYYYYLSLIMID